MSKVFQDIFHVVYDCISTVCYVLPNIDVCSIPELHVVFQSEQRGPSVQEHCPGEWSEGIVAGVGA